MKAHQPHIVEGSPAVVACDPREARVKVVIIFIFSPTDNQPPPRQEGEAVARPRLRQIRDGAGDGGREREQFNAGKDPEVGIVATHHHLPCRQVLKRPSFDFFSC